MTDKKFFHLAPQQEIDDLIANHKTVMELKNEYKQPDWCKYPGALNPDTGCWSLTDMDSDGLRQKISHAYCSTCDCYTGDRDTYIDFESD